MVTGENLGCHVQSEIASIKTVTRADAREKCSPLAGNSVAGILHRK